MATPEEKEAFLRKCFGSVSFFVKRFMGHHLGVNVPAFHEEIYGLLRSEKRLIMAAPRGFAKSYICSIFYPIWAICFKQKKKILIISASEDKAVEFLRAIKTEIESNEIIKAFFGNLAGKGKWTESDLITKTGIQVKARGAGGQIRGYRPDLIILDDIETEETVATKERLNKLEEWIFKACFNCLTPDGQFVWIGTVLTSFALISEHMSRDNGWTKRKYQAYIDGIQDADHCLWKELWSHERLQQQKREVGSAFFATEFMNDPLSDENAPIKPHHIKWWDELPVNMIEVISVDPAYSEDQNSDEKVAARVGMDGQGRRYLIELIHTRCSLNDFMHAIINMYNNNKQTVSCVGVPNKGVEKSFFNSFINESARLNVTVPLTELSDSFTTTSGVSHRNKKNRVIAALQPLFEQGRYFVGKHHQAAVDQLLRIGASKHDDIVDCLAYAEQLFQGNSVPEETAVHVDRYGVPINETEQFEGFGYDY